MPILYRVSIPIVKMWFHTVSDLQISGKENVPKKGALIVVANHLHTADPPLLGAVIPRQIAFMAKDELFVFPKGFFMQSLGAFSARKFTNSGMALRQALKVLNNGKLLGMFPEGKRSTNHQLARGEIGVAYIALRSGALVLPVGISGSERMATFRRPKITVVIGQPFSFARHREKLSKDELRNTTDIIMQRIAQCLPQDYRGIYDEKRMVAKDGNKTGK